MRAPELQGRAWLNTGARELRLADLRGKIVLLDFWTFCCINCLHVLDELRPLEQAYAALKFEPSLPAWALTLLAIACAVAIVVAG